MDPKININTASPKELTQPLSIAKNLADRVVKHHERQGFFTHFEELAEVKGFPAAALDRIRQGATLAFAGKIEEGTSARPLEAEHITRAAKEPSWLYKKIRTTGNADRLKPSA
jgi:Helix-hairpin-helix motif